MKALTGISTSNTDSSRRYFVGNSTYQQLTAILKRITLTCPQCECAMMLICLQPRCGTVVCHQCQLPDHCCHRISELQLALVNHKKLTVPEDSGFTQTESLEQILAYVRTYHRRRMPMTVKEAYNGQKEIEFYDKVLAQSKDIDSLSAICQEVLRTSTVKSKCEWELTQQSFRSKLSVVRFHQHQRPKFLTTETDANIWREAIIELGGFYCAGLSLQPECLMQFLNFTTLREYSARKWGNLLLPIGRLSSVKLEGSSRAFCNKDFEAERMMVLSVPSGFKFSVHTQELKLTRVRYRKQLKLPTMLQSLSLVGTTINLQLPMSLKRLALEFDEQKDFLPTEQELSKLTQCIRLLPALRELTIVGARLKLDQARELVKAAFQPELRALRLHHQEQDTALNYNYLLYKRKLLQGMLMQRSHLQGNYFGEAVLEFAQLEQEGQMEPLSFDHQDYGYCFFGDWESDQYQGSGYEDVEPEDYEFDQFFEGLRLRRYL